MSEKRQYPRGQNRQIIDYSYVVGKMGQDGLYCVDKGVMSIIRYLLSTRGLWRTTYSLGIDGAGYLIPDMADFEPIKNAVNEFLAGADMTCDLTDALNGIRDAITNTACCGPGGANIVEYNGEYYFGTQQPLDAPTSFGQSGDVWATEAEYDQHKCDIAYEIAVTLYNSLTGLSAFSIFELTASAGVASLVFLGILSIPPVAVIATLAVAGLTTGVLLAARDAIDITELQCIMYNSTNAADTYVALKDNITENLSLQLGFAELKIGAIADVIMSMVNTDTINKLFSAYASPASGTDCTACSGPEWWNCNTAGVVLGHTPTTIDLQAEVFGGAYIATLGTSAVMTYTAQIIDGTFTPYPGFASAYDDDNEFACGAGSGSSWDIVSTTQFLSGPYSANKCSFRSTTAYTIRIQVTS